VKNYALSQRQGDDEHYCSENTQELNVVLELIPKPESLNLRVTHIILDHFDVFVFVIHESQLVILNRGCCHN
jgi:hypothetical protein